VIGTILLSAGHSTDWLGVTLAITGAVVSRTVTVNVCVAALACLSDAEQDTTVVPSGKRDPDTGPPGTGSGESTMSVADGLKVTFAPVALAASTTIGDGTVRLGAVVSTTLTKSVAVFVLPASSVARHVIWWFPSARVAPLRTDEPSLSTQSGDRAPITLSFA